MPVGFSSKGRLIGPPSFEIQHLNERPRAGGKQYLIEADFNGIEVAILKSMEGKRKRKLVRAIKVYTT